MSFAECYFKRYKVLPSFVSKAPHSNTNIIVVVPCYNEPDIHILLDSLLSCNKPKKHVEVIIVVNYGVSTAQHIKDCNSNTLKEIELWKLKRQPWFELHSINLCDVDDKDFGVGYARKVGMDEAVKRFGILDNEDGVIVSIDADVTVETNYFEEIEKQFNEPIDACSIYFEHPLSGDDFEEEVYLAVANYELYLRYYIQTLRYTTFPNSYHTIGSCFAVRVKQYTKQGGMNKKQAGEDFYFLHKIIPNGKYIELNSTTVFPSPRPSTRVPFGTGPVVSQIIKNESKKFLTYSIEAFLDLKKLFEQHKDLYQPTKQSFEEVMHRLPAQLVDFLNEIAFWKLIKEVNSNCSGMDSFSNKFFRVFNMLYVLRYMNHSHMSCYSKKPIVNEINKLFDILDIPYDSEWSVFKKLEIVRLSEKRGNV